MYNPYSRRILWQLNLQTIILEYRNSAVLRSYFLFKWMGKHCVYSRIIYKWSNLLGHIDYITFVQYKLILCSLQLHGQDYCNRKTYTSLQVSARFQVTFSSWNNTQERVPWSQIKLCTTLGIYIFSFGMLEKCSHKAEPSSSQITCISCFKFRKLMTESGNLL